MRRTDLIRDYLRGRGGEANLREIYQNLLKDSLRDISDSLTYLVERGELVEGKGGRYRLVEKADGRARQAYLLLWRGAHQLSLRGPWSTGDLAQVTGVSLRGVKYWVAEMKGRGLLVERGEFRYLVAKDAPHRDQPPLFRWPRRGKAKSSRDMKGVANV
ncbi:MAG: hypothetical protein HY794_13475 [Desulfarculus sp.]|nr:hypothetical protein [Desulfarculus sp.]